MKVKIVLVLVLLGILLATPGPAHADQALFTWYTVTLTNDWVVRCDRIVYEMGSRLECINGYRVTHYERSEYKSVAYQAITLGTP